MKNLILFARFLDRDMVLRFYWGLAVGHIYTHDNSTPQHRSGIVPDLPNDIEALDAFEREPNEGHLDVVVGDETREYSLEDRDHADWHESSDSDSSHSCELDLEDLMLEF